MDPKPASFERSPGSDLTSSTNVQPARQAEPSRTAFLTQTLREQIDSLQRAWGRRTVCLSNVESNPPSAFGPMSRSLQPCTPRNHLKSPPPAEEGDSVLGPKVRRVDAPSALPYVDQRKLIGWRRLPPCLVVKLRKKEAGLLATGPQPTPV